MPNWTQEIDKKFIDNSELVRYFYDGDSIKKSDPNYTKACVMAQLFLDNFDAIIANKDYFRNDDTKVWWLNWIDDCFSNSPILRQRYIETKRWYTPELEKVFSDWEK
jgi:hypothetical protein